MTKSKTTRRALLSSCVALMLCFSMLLGTTYAWFTDTASTAVNMIQAGTLDVQLLGKGDAGKFDVELTENSNYLSFTDKNGSTNILWEPGVTFQTPEFVIKNNGNLHLKYQLVINGITGGEAKLLEVIDFTIDGEDIEAGAMYGELAPGAATNPMVISGHMDELADNEYQGLTIDGITVTVFATQLEAEYDSFGNDYDADAMVADYRATPDTIDDILASVEPGKVISLAAGYYDEITLTQDNLTLTSSSAVVGFLNLNAKDGTVINGLTFDESGAKQTYTFETGNKKEATGYIANITGDTDSPKAADNITIKNCTFTNTSGVATAAAEQYIPIYFNEQGAATERATNITINNCVFECNAVQYIGLNYLAVGDVKVTNNTFGGGNYGTSHNTINATGNAANWTITGNEFNNWNVEKTAIGSSWQSNTVNWTITGNEFNNKDGAVILALKTSYNADNSVVTVKNNTVMGGNGTIVTTPVNAENESVYAGHKITLKEELSSIVLDEASGLYWNGNTKPHQGVYYVFGASDLEKAADYFAGQTHSNEANKATFELMTDIDLAGTDWEPWNVMWFTFNGNNHTISNVTAGFASDGRRSGFWGYAGAATIKNLTLENVEVTGSQAGTFAGAGESLTIDNCYLKGTNTVTFASGVETWNGIGAITGVLQDSTVNVEIVEGTTVTLNKGAMATDPGCTYVDNLTGYISANKGAVTNNGTVTVAVAVTADTQEELAAAVSSANIMDVTLSAGTYTMPEPDLRGKTLTITGTKDTVIDVSAVDARDQFVTGATVVFDGVTLNFGKANYMGFANTASLTYKNCDINGLQFLFGENVTFENCDFNSNGAEHCVWTYGAQNVSFTDCDFTYGDRGINCYSDNDVSGGKQTVNFTKCTFATENTASEGAVEINSCFFSVGIEVNLKGCTAPAYGKMAYVSPWDSTNGAKTTINIQ